MGMTCSAPEFCRVSREACLDVLLPLLGEEAAEQAADDIISLIISMYVGTHIYVPQYMQRERQRRNAEIWREFDGTTQSIEALAKKWNLTTIYVYRILAKQREAQRASRPWT
jgi:Mor family transcriptional regulator